MESYKIPEIPEDNASQFPQIAKNELHILWHSDYWDGALSGMIRYKSEPHWFELLTDDYEKIIIDEKGEQKREFTRRFVLLELSDEQYQEELYWHNLFREKVGTHTDYDETGKRSHDKTLKPKEIWPEYYDAVKNRTIPDFTNNKVIGWFEW